MAERVVVRNYFRVARQSTRVRVRIGCELLFSRVTARGSAEPYRPTLVDSSPTSLLRFEGNSQKTIKSEWRIKNA